MPFGGINATRTAGELNRLPEDVSGRALLVGVTSKSGDAGRVFFLGRDVNLRSVLGRGSLADLAIDHYAELNARKPAIGVKADPSIPGSLGDLSKSGDGGGTAALSGDPAEDFELVAVITKAGQRGTAMVKISFDGGDTFLPSALIPSDGALAIADTGVTITFTNHESANPSFLAGDTWTATVRGPAASAADIIEALDGAIAANPDLDFEFVVVAGPSSAADWAAYEQWSFDRAVSGKPCFFVCGLPGRDYEDDEEDMDSWVSASRNEANSFATDRVAVVAGPVEVSRQGRTEQASPLGIFSSRIQAVTVNRQMSRVLDGKAAAIARVDRAFTNTHALFLHDARINTIRRHNGHRSWYWSHARTLAEDGSPYQSLPTVRAMDKLIRLALYAATFSFGDDSSPLEGDGAGLGLLVANIKNAIVNGMVTRTPSELVAVSVEIAPTTNLAADGKAIVIVKAQPVDHIEDIEIQIGVTSQLVTR